MPIFGLASVTIAAMVLFVRSSRTGNKALVTLLWAVTTAYFLGLRL